MSYDQKHERHSWRVSIKRILTATAIALTIAFTFGGTVYALVDLEGERLEIDLEKYNNAAIIDAGEAKARRKAARDTEEREAVPAREYEPDEAENMLEQLRLIQQAYIDETMYMPPYDGVSVGGGD